MATALVTGASRGFGRAVARALAVRGWTLIVDGRDPARLDEAAGELRTLTAPGRVTAIAGDVADPTHRDALAAAVRDRGGLDLLLNNASELGPSPMPTLDRYPIDALVRVYAVDVFAPLALMQLVLPALVATGGVVVNVSSDAAVEAYEGWGGYGSAKAALDQLTAVFAAEQPSVRAYAFDPGDMRTDMHQRAFPGEDISDRPEPETVVPALLRLVTERPAGWRYRASDLLAPAGSPA